ncbi:4-hydroxy-tetrahydrodipicolinate synthase [Texcoconibacillus texcoconensis]|uniref:4-hydroxy-tetrahydrodipicolinate synthase n=1 Tax=Texcoconibacillus texcoconensis TaxID=1095777 RepID=A0A840QCH4_9BACI|nr:4-hydroxy-tetrahydrodipicolinate synthase [Texcoconibacillus texcoconensis]
MNFGQVVTAMVTPFDNKQNVDLNKTTTLIEHLIHKGSDAIVVSGTTGESPTLTKEEKLTLFEHCVKVVNGRVPVIAGTGSNNTSESIALTKEAEKLGVDAIMLVTPYYNKPSQRMLYEHFKVIAQETSLPVMPYNVPGRTAVNMQAETTIALSKIDNIVAVKEASGNLEQITKIIAETDAGFKVYSGDDSLTLPIVAVGGDGIVSVSSHIIGEEMQEMVTAYKNGNIVEAARIHQEILPVIQGMFSAPSPSPVKAALQLIGVDVGSVRQPILPLTEEELAYVSSLVKQTS